MEVKRGPEARLMSSCRVDLQIKAQINEELTSIEKDKGCRLLYACESGSRAWGFASTDSDYDVRFIYVHPPEWYLQVLDRKDTVELPLTDELDFSGWELRKALRLFLKSNGALVEWLRSPIVYRENTELMNEWRSMVDEVIHAPSLAGHYYGMTMKVWHRMNDAPLPTAKRYLYAIRSLLCAQWAHRRETAPPVLFAELYSQMDLPAEVVEAIETMIAEKAGEVEKQERPRIPVLDKLIETGLEEMSGREKEVVDLSKKSKPVDAFCRKVILGE